MAKFFDIKSSGGSNSHDKHEVEVKKDRVDEPETQKDQDSPPETKETPKLENSDAPTNSTDGSAAEKLFIKTSEPDSKDSDEKPSDKQEDKNEEHKEQPAPSHSKPSDELLSQAPHIPRATSEMAPKKELSKLNISLSPVTSSSRKQKTITAILSILLIVLLALLVSQAVIFFNQTRKSSQSTSSPGKVVIGEIATPTPSASSSPKASSSPSAASSPSASPTPSAPTKASVTVRVLNGSGVAGAANKVSGLAQAAGFSVTGTGNAKSYTYQTTQVLYKDSTLKSLADELAKGLTGYTTEVKEDATAVGSASDILVIVGKK